MATAMLEHLNRETLSSYLNTKFRLFFADSQAFEVELIEVTGGETARWENFSIVFRGPVEHPFGQRIYRMQHEQLGDFELFLVPIRQDAQGFYYEAVFNRVKE
jgi:hypothetical protein